MMSFTSELIPLLSYLYTWFDGHNIKYKESNLSVVFNAKLIDDRKYTYFGRNMFEGRSCINISEVCFGRTIKNSFNYYSVNR